MKCYLCTTLDQNMRAVKTNSIKAWILAARPKTLAAAATPVLLGCALSYSDEVFQWTPALLCFLFAFSMQIDANFINDYYDSYSLKTFTKPTIAKDNPYLTPTSANVPTNGLASPTYNNYSINNNSFSISYQRVRYIQNDDLLSMCSIGGTNNRSFMIFNFSTPITRMDIDLGIYTYLKYNSNTPSSTYKDSRVDLTKGNYKINILENENTSN